MPPSEKTRVEVYVPDTPASACNALLDAFVQEFPYVLGVCTLLRGLSGSYLSVSGLVRPDRANLLYTDTPFFLSNEAALLARYADELRDAALQALNEEAIFVALWPVFYAELSNGRK